MMPPGVFSADDTVLEDDVSHDDKSAVESRTETEGERDRVYMKIGGITVTGKADCLTTADVIGSDRIGTENVDFSMELLKKVTGFLL